MARFFVPTGEVKNLTSNVVVAYDVTGDFAVLHPAAFPNKPDSSIFYLINDSQYDLAKSRGISDDRLVKIIHTGVGRNEVAISILATYESPSHRVMPIGGH